MKIIRLFAILLFSLLPVLLSSANASAQLSNIAWKAAQQLKQDYGNKVKYNDEGFVTEVVIADLPGRFIMGHLAVFPHLESVTIESSYYFEDSNMGGVRKLKNLKKFSLRNSRYATAATLELLAEAPSLESLDLYENDSISSLHDLSRIRRLKHLSIVPEEALSYAPLQECKLLESLKLTGSNTIDDSSVKEIAKIGTLQSIDLSDTAITDEGLAELGKLTKLRELKLHDCETITGEAFAEFQFPETLTSLDLTDVAKLNDDGLIELKRFTQLEHLWLDGSKELKGRGFECLAAMKKLKTLSCPESSISDKHLTLLDGIATLKTILLYGCTGVSGRGLDRLSKSQGCTKLSLNNCSKIDSPDFSVLAKFKNLEELYIANTRIKNDDIELLCQLKKLRILNIKGNLWLDDTSFESLEMCSVEKLIATRLPRLTDASFRSVSKMKNLTNLSVTANKNLDGTGVEAFAGNTQMKKFTFEAPGFLLLDACKSISKLTGVEELYFEYGKVSVSQLEQLSGMPNLRKLRYELEDADSTSERLISILKTFPKLDR